MEYITNLLLFALILVLTGTFVFLCLVCMRFILQWLLSPRLIRLHEAIRPFFEPSADPKSLEKSFWLQLSNAVLVILTIVVAIFIFNVIDALRDLFLLI